MTSIIDSMLKEKFNFSQVFKEVEEINQWFQGEDIDIDEALKKFKYGLELIKKCQERLKEVENKFYDIKKELGPKEIKNTENNSL